MPETEQADEEQWVDVARFPSLDEAQENALVALAMGEAIRVDHGEVPGEFELSVEPAAVPRVSEELRGYAAEAEVKLPPPLVSTSWSHHPAGALHYIVWAAVLLFVFHQQSQDPTLADRYASSSIGLIAHGVEEVTGRTELRVHRGEFRPLRLVPLHHLGMGEPDSLERRALVEQVRQLRVAKRDVPPAGGRDTHG